MGFIVVSIIGRDKPGMLAEIATIISNEGGNIENINGHTLYIERGKKLANISMIVSGEDIGALYQKLHEKLRKFADENNLIIHLYPLGHLMGEEEEEMKQIEED